MIAEHNCVTVTLLVCLMAAQKCLLRRIPATPTGIIGSVRFEGIRLHINRFGAALSILTVLALASSACGTDKNVSGGNTTTATSAAKVACGGKSTVKASGSTAQANAITRFVKVFEQACTGQSLNYTA